MKGYECVLRTKNLQKYLSCFAKFFIVEEEWQSTGTVNDKNKNKSLYAN